ncbi:PA2169 family four-helix-bundle protein [Aggregatimonas sangjinii]|uniref:PA2169 family four-helix-bundle protein n=1 Tax=Aggregatimonas sangjinii TaxID=2583587 RepID=A0A5B7SQP4_9FLAO|nr:PA2169 family four-helix-bundle protein [Aggregatimonas sangjinii]QCW98963.1 PA2169 family four-helix-bundle protein [Aggregatimonas sangjinii]
MNDDVKKIEEKLQEVIDKTEDAIKGFNKAAENASDVSTKTYFSRRAKNRQRFLTQLKNASPDLRLGNEDIDGTTAGAVHRTWMDVKAFFSADNDESMLEEAVRGDKSAIEEYNEVLAETHVPARVKEILREQRDAIQNDLETSEILEDFR